MASSFLRFIDHTQHCIIFGKTPLEEWSARRRDLYLTTYITHNKQTSMPPSRFEPTISADERPQTQALDRAATGTVKYWSYWYKNMASTKHEFHETHNHTINVCKHFLCRITEQKYTEYKQICISCLKCRVAFISTTFTNSAKRHNVEIYCAHIGQEIWVVWVEIYLRP
jgi:hypothetical protein